MLGSPLSSPDGFHRYMCICKPVTAKASTPVIHTLRAYVLGESRRRQRLQDKGVVVARHCAAARLKVQRVLRLQEGRHALPAPQPPPVSSQSAMHGMMHGSLLLMS